MFRNKFYTFFASLGIIALSLIIIFIFSFFKNKATDEAHQASFERNYAIYTIDFPDTITFAGEIVPVEYNDVRESFDRELLINVYWQSQTMLWIKRANRYFSMIEEVLREEGVPDDFKYIPVVESGLLHLVSPAGAAGYWQFLEGTARDYGLEVNTEVDERYHVAKATRAACKYFKHAYEQFGNWTMAAASYNIGRRELMRQQNAQKQNSYYNLKLNNETGRYVYRLIAAKTIMTNPEKYGFNIRAKDLYPQYAGRIVVADTTILDLALFAESFGVNYKVLQFANPWIRSFQITNHKRKKYEFFIPAETARLYKLE
jgi:membrane-bound lytic murein transglycosylase D